MRGCAGLKLSEACVWGAGGAMARGWSTPQSRPRVAVPTGLFLGNRHARGSRLESVFCCFDVRALVYSLLPNVSGHRRRLVRRTVERLVRLHFLVTVTDSQELQNVIPLMFVCTLQVSSIFGVRSPIPVPDPLLTVNSPGSRL